jgi:hypothetical protein
VDGYFILKSFYVCYFVLLYGYANFYALLDCVAVKTLVDPRPAVVWVEENIEEKTLLSWLTRA